jgi:hypothetical protein
MKLTEQNERALQWALSNRMALANLSQAVENVWRARDVGHGDDVRMAENNLEKAHQIASKILGESW